MKKLLFTAIIGLTFACVPVDASLVMLDYFGETHVTSNNIERTLLVNSNDGVSYNVAIRPLDEYISNWCFMLIFLLAGSNFIKSK